MIIENFSVLTMLTGTFAANLGYESYLFFSENFSPMPAVGLSPLGSVFAYFVFILVIFLSFILPLLFVVPMILNWRKNRHILRHGEPAQAKILKIWDTGVTIDDKPQVGMLLEVYPENLASFQAEAKKVISILDIPKIQTGAPLQVKFDPRNLSQVAVVL